MSQELKHNEKRHLDQIIVSGIHKLEFKIKKITNLLHILLIKAQLEILKLQHTVNNKIYNNYTNKALDSRSQAGGASGLKTNKNLIYKIDNKLITKIMNNHLDQVILIQATIRGFITRYYTKLLKAQLKIKKKYFLDEEYQETISQTNRINIQSLKKQQTNTQELTRREYVYKCSGAKYNGQWLYGFRHGKGSMQWLDGARFEGMWNFGKACGQGIFTHTKGEIYEGHWMNDKAHGNGMYVHSNGAKYEGDWQHDLQHGLGQETWPDGSLFIGQYIDGKKNGKGKYLWVDGASYEGEWEDNEIAGYGFYQWVDGRKYIGHWKSNIMDDFGIYTWQDGRTYEGFYQDDKKHGYGVYTWSDQKKYAGWWSNGKQHGIGVFISKEGKKKMGLWEDGKKIGWFNSEEVKLIESEKGESYLQSCIVGGEESWNKIKEFPREFTPSQEFYKARQYLQYKISHLNLEVPEINETFHIQASVQQSTTSMAGVDQGNLI
eukprot:403358433